MLQGDSKQRRVELRLDSVEEGGLGPGADGVDGAESEAEQTVIVHILKESRANLAGGFNSLASSLDTTNSDSVLVDITAGRATITVGDGPGAAGQLGGTAARLIDAVATLLGRCELRREHPPMTVSCGSCP